jgi:hypothetical protein
MGLFTQDCCLHMSALTPIHQHELLTPGSGCMQAHLVNYETMATSRNKAGQRLMQLPEAWMVTPEETPLDLSNGCKRNWQP